MNSNLLKIKTDEFFTEASKDSRSEYIPKTRVTPEIADMLGYIFENSHKFGFPFRRRGDIIRDALVHRLVELVKMTKDPRLKTLESRLIVIERRIQAARRIAEFQSTISSLVPTINQMCGMQGGRKEAVTLLADTIRDIEEMPQFWSENYLSELKIKLGGIYEEAFDYAHDYYNLVDGG